MIRRCSCVRAQRSGARDGSRSPPYVNLKEARDRARKAGNLDGRRLLILIAARQRWRHGNLCTSEIDVCSRQNARRRWGPRRRGSTGNAIRPKSYLVSRQGPRPGIQARRLGFWQSTICEGCWGLVERTAGGDLRPCKRARQAQSAGGYRKSHGQCRGIRNGLQSERRSHQSRS